MSRYDDDDRDDGPIRKKKKKKKKPAAPPWLKIAAFAGGGIVVSGLVALVIWVMVSATGGGPPAQPVTAWDKFSTDEIGFAFDYPKGWRSSSFGIKNRREAEIKGSGASIAIQENLTGSLVGDIAGAATAGQQVSDELLPVSKVHELRRPKEMPASYKEEPAVTVMTKFGKARCSAYTNGSKRGYRATVLMNQSALDIFCECRASDWDVLRPAFDHVLESMGLGGG